MDQNDVPAREPEEMPKLVETMNSGGVFEDYGVKRQDEPIELLVTPDDLIRVMGGSRIKVGGLGGVEAFIRMPTVEEFKQMTREARATLVAMGVPDNFPPEQPDWQIERIVTPLPGEVVSKLLGVPHYG